MDLQLKGLTALITGSSRGLGFAAAMALAKEGARVVINARHPDKLSEAASRIKRETRAEVYPIPGDVTNATFPAELIAAIQMSLGNLDILITNAGGPPSGQFESFDDIAWQKAIDLSFLSQVRLIRSALPLLKQSQAASVLTVTSYSVKQPIPNLILSNSIRAATVGLTKTLALELGSERIRFNSILPGWTETERVYDLMRYRAQINNTSLDEELKKLSRESPLDRIGTAEEFGRVAAFMVSPAASFMTGVMLNLDGGMYKGTF
jgi:3-oxoacyl-[acyl-carrier protein] reductase